jgi:hypothetical protein
MRMRMACALQVRMLCMRLYSQTLTSCWHLKSHCAGRGRPARISGASFAYASSGLGIACVRRVLIMRQHGRQKMTPVGFEPTQLALVELESTPLDHSGKVSLFLFFPLALTCVVVGSAVLDQVSVAPRCCGPRSKPIPLPRRIHLAEARQIKMIVAVVAHVIFWRSAVAEGLHAAQLWGDILACCAHHPWHFGTWGQQARHPPLQADSEKIAAQKR